MMNRIAAFLIIIAAFVLADGISMHANAPVNHKVKEIVIMSRPCDSGWDVDSQDGVKLTMSCIAEDESQ